MKNLIGKIIVFAFLAVTFVSCEVEKTPTPTHELMQGVWELTEAYNANDSSIIDSINRIFPTYIHLDGNNSVNSTAAPLFMYIVYGKSKFVSVMSQLDAAFGYSDNQITEGEFFMKKTEVVDKFTIEMKMKFISMQTLTTILNMMGIQNTGILEEVIYHKFMDVTVDITDENTEKMTWYWDNSVRPIYNIKDEYGNYVLWNGVTVNSFSRCKLVWTKRSKSLTELISEHNASKK